MPDIPTGETDCHYEECAGRVGPGAKGRWCRSYVFRNPGAPKGDALMRQSGEEMGTATTNTTLGAVAVGGAACYLCAEDELR